MSINRVFLLGNLGKDPELRYTPQQVPVCSFSVATSERRKDNSGAWVDHTDWHNIVVFGRVAENCNNYLKKGRQAFIEGRIQTRKWQDKEGKDRYTTEIIANNVQFVGGKGQGDSPGSYPSGDDFNESPGQYGSQPGADILSSFQTADSMRSGGASKSAAPDLAFDDDDVPF